MREMTPDGNLPSTAGGGGVDTSLLDDFSELSITNGDDELLTSLLKETGWGERNKGKDGSTPVILPIDWVVDIADKDGDWFIGTATGYNDAKQTLRVMVPDREAPTWTGDVAVHPVAVRLLECCDNRTAALFKQLVRESAIEVDWDLCIHRSSELSERPVEALKTESNCNSGGNSDHSSDAEQSNLQAAGRDIPEEDTKENETTAVTAPAPAPATVPATSTQDTVKSEGEDLPPAASSAPESTATAEASRSPNSTARATLLLPLGNLVVVELEGGSGQEVAKREVSASGVDGDGDTDDKDDSGEETGAATAAVNNDNDRRLVRLDDRVELLQCRGNGGPGEEAFYRVAEEGLVSYDPAKINWRAHKRKARMRRQDERRRGSLAQSSSSGIEALTAPFGQGGVGGEVSLLEGVGKEIRGLARRALEARDALLSEHLATLKRVRRLVLDGSLEDGAALMEQVDEANVGVLDERSARDTERITTDASALEALVFAIAGQLEAQATSPERRSSLRLPPSPPLAGDGRSKGRRESSASTGGTEEAQDLAPALAVAVVGGVAGSQTKKPGAASGL